MADLVHLSKTQKKRQRQAAKKMLEKLNEEKLQDPVSVESKDPLTALKEQLAEAKRMNDHKLASKIRQDIWVLQDTSAGHNPDISAAEVDESLSRITSSCSSNNVEEKTTENKSSLNPIEKKIRNLEKKLQQIDILKEKQKKGEKLEQTQIAKIQTESKIKQEIEDMKVTLASVAISK